jgi:SpoIID/LytB domain protein
MVSWREEFSAVESAALSPARRRGRHRRPDPLAAVDGACDRTGSRPSCAGGAAIVSGTSAAAAIEPAAALAGVAGSVGGLRRAGWALAAVALVAAGVAVQPVLSAGRASAGAAVPPQTVTLLGSGFGHGVGMSQYGALGQAQAGRTANQILTYYYSGTKVVPVPDSLLLKVNLLHRATSVRFHTIPLAAHGGGLQVVVGGVGTYSGNPADTWSVTDTRAGLVLTRRTGRTVTTFRPSSAVTVRWAGTRYMSGPATLIDVAGPGDPLTSGADLYRSGAIEIRAVHGAIEVADVLRLHDEYLDGIAEMPSAWPLQALRAQAIASRTYALRAYSTGVAASCDCNLYASTFSQSYSGWAKQSAPRWGAAWVSAVASTSTSATTGLAVLSGNHPIDAFFTSSTGGVTRSSASVWGGRLPYAVGVFDSWSLDPAVNPEAAWSETVTTAQLRAAFSSLPNIARFRLTAFNRDGTLATATAWSSSGRRATVSGAGLASILGLPSQWITSFITTLPGSSPPSADIPVVAGHRAAAGREWLTSCATSATVTRCTDWIKASTVQASGGTYALHDGWTLNGVTTLAPVTSTWNSSPLAVPGTHQLAGRAVRVTCSVPRGPRICTDRMLTTVVSAKPRSGGGFVFTKYRIWMFTGQVRLRR